MGVPATAIPICGLRLGVPGQRRFYLPSYVGGQSLQIGHARRIGREMAFGMADDTDLE